MNATPKPPQTALGRISEEEENGTEPRSPALAKPMVDVIERAVTRLHVRNLPTGRELTPLARL